MTSTVPTPRVLTLLIDLEKSPGARRYTDEEYNLDGFRAFLDRLGNPQAHTPWIHLAGTKGKGSTAAICEALLRAEGLRTGLFTSPHLRHFGERFRIDGEALSPEGLETLLAPLEPHVAPQAEKDRREAGGVRFRTVFEVLTAAAFLHFREARADVGVLETGLGGRLDCTNVVDPTVCIVTPIGFDHTRILGTEIERIAAEKAGILKPGRPAVLFSPQSDVQARAHRVVVERAREIGAPLVEPAGVRVLETSGARQRVAVTLPSGTETVADFALPGAHQAQNLGLAVAACEAFLQTRGRSLSAGAIERACASIRWPGRLELLPGTPPVVLDGAHCPLSASALGAGLVQLGTAAPPPHVLLWSMQADKDHRAFLREFANALPADALEAIVVFGMNGPRSANVETLANAARETLPQVRLHSANTLQDALALVRAEHGQKTLVTAGSLYFLDTIREMFRNRKSL